MENTPTLQTKRLLLRRFAKDDTLALFLIMSDREANRFLPWLPFETIGQAEHFLSDRYLKSYRQPFGYQYAICLKEDNFPVGYVHVSSDDSHDFGYALRTEYWHRGITTEACRAVVAQLKQDGLPYITATHDVNNPRSGEVMKKIGMAYQYSYQELWQPKNFLVTFRMYQLNFSGHSYGVYRKYWNQYPHFVEENV